MTAKRQTGLVAVVEKFVGGLELEDSEHVLGRVAIELARSLEEAPAYARAPLSRELRECLAALQQRAYEVEESRARRRPRVLVRAPVEGNGR
jgi:hypothetical protein